MDSDKPCSDLELSDGCVDNTSLEVNNSGVVFTHESLAAEAMTQSGCETRPEKRSREMDPNEVWTIVGRRGKRQARVDSNDSELIIPQEKIEVSIISKDKLAKQISLARLLKAEGITDVMRVKYINAYKVLIQLKDDKSADKLLACQALIEKGFRCQKTMDVDKSYGIIRDIDLDLSDDEVLQNISCDIPILGVRRQKRRNFETNEFELTEVVQVCFSGSSLPKYIKSHDVRVNVEPYIFPVTQCSKCWKYGHTIRVCPTRLRCPKCGKNHPNCETTKFRCVNCGGAHMALSRTCPLFVKEKKMREIMAEFNCSYRRALTIYVPPSPIPTNVREEEEPISVDKTHVTTIMNGARTYAQATQHSSHRSVQQAAEEAPVDITDSTTTRGLHRSNTNDKNTKKRKYRKRSRKENVWWDGVDAEFSSADSIDSSPQREDTERVDKQSRKEGGSFVDLLLKLKNAIFMRGCTWEEKIKLCIKHAFEYIMCASVDFISTIPWLKTVFVNS